MVTLYERDNVYYYPTENGLEKRYGSHPVLFSDMFPLFSGLKFDWDNGTVERNGNVYYFDEQMSFGNLPSPSEWMSIAGNSVQYEYYTGTVAQKTQNPTGNKDNVRYIRYLSKDILKYVVEIQYDSRDNPIWRKSLIINKATAGDVGGATDNEIIDVSDRLEIDRLNMLPNYKATVKSGSFIFDQNAYYLFASQTVRTNPLTTDGILIDSNVSKIGIKLNTREPLNNSILVTIVNADGDILKHWENFVHNYETWNNDTEFTYINNSEGDKYALVSVGLSKKLDNLSLDKITQKALGLSVTLYGFVNIIINDSVNPVSDPIKVPEGAVILADYLPENSDPNFAGYVDGDGNSIDINAPINITKNFTIIATYN